MKKTTELVKKENNKHLQSFEKMDFNKIHSATMKILTDRTGCELNSSEEMIFEDVKYRFPSLTTEEFKESLKNGGLGMYGDIYGNKITSLIVCTWINKYLIDKKWHTI